MKNSKADKSPEPEFDKSKTAWISRGFEQLVAEYNEAATSKASGRGNAKNGKSPKPFDVLIVGSGYGGAIAADTLSQYEKIENGVRTELKICVLERGNEYLQGSFPENSTELPGHVRYKGKKDGLFDFRAGPDVATLIANGVGGGSLINAGVMLEPLDNVFKEGWPSNLSNKDDLKEFYDKAEELLGSNGNKIITEAGRNTKLRKYKVIRHLAGINNLDPAKKTIKAKPANITVAAKKGPNSANVELHECIRCCDCATGCNHNAKNSLDVNLLYRAHCRGVKIYSGVTVLKIERDDSQRDESEKGDSNKCWVVNAVFTDSKLRAQHKEPTKLYAKKVILAAGVLGSTEILKRSESKSLKFSRMLGQRCSTNGDSLIIHYDVPEEVIIGDVKAVAKESVAPEKRDVGPTITGIIDFRRSEDPVLGGLLIEEMASPAAMQRVFSELYATVNTLHQLGDRDRTTHKTGFHKKEDEDPRNDIYELRESQIDHTALYAVMGDDCALGEIELVDSAGAKCNGDISIDQDGLARIRWPGIAHIPLFDQQEQAIRKLAEEQQEDAITELPDKEDQKQVRRKLAKENKGTVIPNPLWKLLPKNTAQMAKVERGPVVTVHPLGGCVMADSSTDGVVNHMGQVFNRDDPKVPHPGLVVLDGSIIPTALVANPALTIAAVALRAAHLLSEEWVYDKVKDTAPIPGGKREVFRTAAVDKPFGRVPTEIRLTERISGKAWLWGLTGGVIKQWDVELTLRFKDKKLIELTHPSEPRGDARLIVDEPVADLIESRLRIFKAGDLEKAHEEGLPASEMEEHLNKIAKFSAPITGSLTVLERQKSRQWVRIARSSSAWLLNYGYRDIFQSLRDILPSRSDSQKRRTLFQWIRDLFQSLRDILLSRSDSQKRRTLFQWIRDLFAFGSHAGERRTLKYDLTLGATKNKFGIPERDIKITGKKTFTYARRSNPWKQLMDMTLTRFPRKVWLTKPVLSLDLAFLARIRVPLLEITKQNDGVTALGEFGSFLAYLARLVVGIHGWSFRAPDDEKVIHVPRRLPGKLDDMDNPRLPGKLDGIDPPKFYPIRIGNERPYGSKKRKDDPSAKVPVFVRLTRYANRSTADKPPIVMMHGYSASGTTFAHNAVKDNYASFFHKRGRDVWVVDFRTSCGMPTARFPWSFEQVAYRDIPEAIKRVCDETNCGKVDVIAHCMGAAMFSMAILHPNESLPDIANGDALKNLYSRINRVVFTQVGPLVVFSPTNIFRGYVMGFLRELLPDNYEFNPGPDATVADKLLDRLLTTVPYPKEEFRIENPLRPWMCTPWTRTRHRMDILYGRVFNVRNMDKKVLEHIDDFFGPLSIATVTQTINFARYSMITDVKGRNTFVSTKTLCDKWGDTKLLMLNARQNGLVDYSTGHRMNEKFKVDAGRSVKFVEIEDAGHQDCVIGNEPRRKALEQIGDFLDPDRTKFEDVKNPTKSIVAYTPWIGPVVTTEGQGCVEFRVEARPTRTHPAGLLAVRVEEIDKKLEGLNADDIRDSGYFLTSEYFRDSHWETFKLPPMPKLESRAADKRSNAWLVMVVYDESGALPFNKVQQLLCREPAEKASGRATESVTWARPRRVAAQALMDRLNSENFDFRDGVIPDRPPAREDECSFVLTSCQYPAGLLDGSVAYQSYDKTLERLKLQGTDKDKPGDNDIVPRFGVFAGDQIYADASAGLFDPSVKNGRFELPYHMWLCATSVRGVLRRIPSYMLLDDHEINDNWEPLSNDPDNAGLKANGVKGYKKHQRGMKDSNSDPLSFYFPKDGFNFFMLDTRSKREVRNTRTSATANIAEKEAFDLLSHWLCEQSKNDDSRPKFIVTPSMLLPRHRVAAQWNFPKSSLRSDGWDGYPNSLFKLLKEITDKQYKNVVFLSGDEHLPCFAQIVLTKNDNGKKVVVHSIHTAAAFAPYPFANSMKERHLVCETICFDNQNYQCQVETMYPKLGDGMTFLRVWKDKNGGAWRIRCEFAKQRFYKPDLSAECKPTIIPPNDSRRPALKKIQR